MFDWPGQGCHGPAARMFDVGGGAEIECVTWGCAPDAATTIMLLHEGLGCIKLWRDFPERLAAATGCGVFAYSRLGYGTSHPIEPPLPVTRMADEARVVLPKLIDAIAPEQLILIGHSDGGTIAAHYLAGVTHATLKAAVLMSAHFFCEPSNVAAIRNTKTEFEQGDLRRRLAKYHGDVDGAFYGWADTWLHPAFQTWQMHDEIERWQHPVMFVQGRDDPYGSQAQAKAAARSPHAKIEWLDGCAHSPHLQQPEQTLRLIAGFIGAAP